MNIKTTITKMGKKQQIVEASLQLFNTEGFVQVTMRDIAKSLNMSPGNLTYHFKKKEDLVHHILEDISSELKACFPRAPFTLTELHNVLYNIADIQIKYAFFFSGSPGIMVQYPKMKEIRQKLMRERIGELSWQLKAYQKEGLVTSGDYLLISKSVWLIIAGWIPQNKLLADTEYTISKDQFVKMVWQLLLPVLTDEGKETVKRLLEEKPSLVDAALASIN